MTSVDTLVRQDFVSLLLGFHERMPLPTLRRLMKRLEGLLYRVDMSTRLEVLSTMVRVYARVGQRDDAGRLFDRIEDDVRAIVANLEDASMARQFLQRFGYGELVEEIARLQRRGAHIGSVDAGARSPQHARLN